MKSVGKVVQQFNHLRIFRIKRNCFIKAQQGIARGTYFYECPCQQNMRIKVVRIDSQMSRQIAHGYFGFSLIRIMGYLLHDTLFDG